MDTQISRYDPEHPDRPQYARREDLPMPFATDMVPIGVEAHDWWCCRYCDAGECNIGLTTEAEATRALAHQAFCQHRPVSGKPDARELEAFRSLFGNDCLREMDLCASRTKDLRQKLSKTWWPLTRRRLRKEIQTIAIERQRAVYRLCDVTIGRDPRELVFDESGNITLMSEDASVSHPVYRIVPEPAEGGTQRYMITCDEGWRSMIVCERMYYWSAVWLLGLIDGAPYAPDTRS